MKFKYLKKFNESTGGDLTFDEYKQIMFEILDEVGCNYDFNEIKGSQDGDFSESYYDCHIYLPDDMIDIEDYIGYDIFTAAEIPDTESGDEEINYGGSYQAIDRMISRCEQRIIDMPKIIERYNQMKTIIRVLEEKIEPRLRNYNNCESVYIGFDAIPPTFRITYEIRHID